MSRSSSAFVEGRARQGEEQLGLLLYGRMAVWPEFGPTPVALWGGTPRMQGRFVRGTALGRDASYEGALYERNRFVYPLVS